MNRKLAEFWICLFITGIFCEIAAACAWPPCPPPTPCYHFTAWPNCALVPGDCGSGYSCCGGDECYNTSTQGCCQHSDGYGYQVCDNGKKCCGSTECCDPAANKCCFDGSCATHGPWGPSISVSLSMPDYIVDKVQSAINRIPGTDTSINNASISATTNERDCCQGGTIVSDGESYAEGTGTLSAELDGIALWGGGFHKNFEFGDDWSVTVDCDAGVILGADFSVSGTVGYRENTCKNESCLYGSLNASATINCEVTAGVTGCVETPVGTYCGGASVSPLGVNVTLSGNLGCNSSESCNGYYGDVTVGSIVFTASVNCGPATASWNVTIYEGD